MSASPAKSENKPAAPAAATPPVADTNEKKGDGITLQQKKALFEKYEAAAAKEKALDEQMKKISQEKSEAIKEIEAMLGKGPFLWKNDELIITKRGETYYFRSRGRAEVEKIG